MPFTSHIYDVTAYGAVGDGSTDDYTAISNAIAAGVASAKPFELYFPAATYKCSNQLVINLANNGQSLTIKGDGIGVTQIYFSNSGSSSGIVVNRAPSGGYYTTDAPFTALDFSLVASGTTGTALKLTMSTGNDAGTMGSRLFRVGFYRTTNGSTNWGVGVWLENWASVVFEDCQFMNATTGIYIHGSNGATSGFRVIGCCFQGGTYGIDVDGTGTASNRIEELISVGSTYVLQTTAIRYRNSGRGGQFQVLGGHLTSTSGGIIVSGINGFKAIGCNFLAAGINYTGISASDCDSSFVANCDFSSTGYSNGTGVTVSGSSRGWRVHDNDFVDFATDVSFASTVSGSAWHDNATNGGAYVDSAGTNIGFSTYSGAGAYVQMSVDQSVAVSGGTTLAFATKNYDDAGMWSSSVNTRLTVPARATRVRPQANISWENNSSGFRYAYIYKNGTTRVASQLQLPTANCQLSVCGPIMNVNAGDYFEVVVEQSSGSTISVLATSETNFSLEVIR